MKRASTRNPASLLVGRVMHARARPVEHRFSYPVFQLRLPLTRLAQCAAPLFSVDRPNVVAFHQADHGARDGTPLVDWIRALLAREGLGVADGEIWLHCFPRVLGYVFNPVSFWFCEDRAGATRAILAAVNNTFGERHSYLLAHPDARPIVAGDVFHSDKVFHVSPFFPVAGRYRFRFAAAQGVHRARIEYFDRDGPLLDARIAARAVPLEGARLARVLATQPAMTLGVIARIHWQALRLWAKRAPFHRKPNPPLEEVTR